MNSSVVPVLQEVGAASWVNNICVGREPLSTRRDVHTEHVR